MWPHWACVAAEQGLKEKYIKPATTATLAQGDLEVEAGRRAGWAAAQTGKKLARGTKGQLFERLHCRTALGWQGLSFPFAKTMTAAAWTVKVNSWEFEVRCFCTNVLSSFRANERVLLSPL